MYAREQVHCAGSGRLMSGKQIHQLPKPPLSLSIQQTAFDKPNKRSAHKKRANKSAAQSITVDRKRAELVKESQIGSAASERSNDEQAPLTSRAYAALVCFCRGCKGGGGVEMDIIRLYASLASDCLDSRPSCLFTFSYGDLMLCTLLPISSETRLFGCR